MYHKQTVSLFGSVLVQTHEPGGHRDGVGDGEEAVQVQGVEDVSFSHTNLL